MLKKQKIFKFISPCSWLSLLLLMGLGCGIERLVTISGDIAREVENIQKIIFAQATEKNNSSCEEHNVRGCDSERFVSEIS